MSADGERARGLRRVVGVAITTLVVLAAAQAPAAAWDERWGGGFRGGDAPSWEEVLRWWQSSGSAWPWGPRRTPDAEPPPKEGPETPPEEPSQGPKTPPPVTTPDSPKAPPVTVPVPPAPPVVAAAPVVAAPAPSPPAPAEVGVPSPLLQVRKTGPARVRAGSVTRFRVTVVNRGTGAAVRVRVADILPGGFAVVGAGARLSSGRPTWSVARLDPGASRTFVIAVRAAAQMRAGARCNRVRVTAPGATPAAGRACFTVTALPPRRRVPAVTG